METKAAVNALSALAHETRLAVFRSLVQAGPDGVPAGELARSLGVVPNTMSAHLNILSHADLVVTRRLGRSIIYTATYDKIGELLCYLMQDCCAGNPQVCIPLAELASRAACCEKPEGALS